MSFDFIAPVYDLLARLVFGRAISRSQTHFLHKIPPGAKVLVVGGGTGWILLDIFQRANPGEVLYLEASSRMLAKAKKTAAALPEAARARISWLQGTEQDLQPGERIDVVLTFFLLDLFPQEAMMTLCLRLDQALKPGGYWFFADFHIPASFPWKQLAKACLRLMYCFFRITSGVPAKHLPDFQGFFSGQSYLSQQIAYFYRGMIRSEYFRKPQ